MPLLDLGKAPHLVNADDLLRWSRDLGVFLNNRTGQLVLPYGKLMVVNGANQDLEVMPLTYLEVTGASAPFSIGGLAGGTNGRLLFLANASGQTMTLNNLDAGSQVTNRISTLTGGNVVVNAAILVHAINSTWILFAHA